MSLDKLPHNPDSKRKGRVYKISNANGAGSLNPEHPDYGQTKTTTVHTSGISGMNEGHRVTVVKFDNNISEERIRETTDEKSGRKTIRYKDRVEVHMPDGTKKIYHAKDKAPDKEKDKKSQDKKSEQRRNLEQTIDLIQNISSSTDVSSEGVTYSGLTAQEKLYLSSPYARSELSIPDLNSLLAKLNANIERIRALSEERKALLERDYKKEETELLEQQRRNDLLIHEADRWYKPFKSEAEKTQIEALKKEKENLTSKIQMLDESRRSNSSRIEAIQFEITKLDGSSYYATPEEKLVEQRTELVKQILEKSAKDLFEASPEYQMIFDHLESLQKRGLINGKYKLADYERLLTEVLRNEFYKNFDREVQTLSANKGITTELPLTSLSTNYILLSGQNAEILSQLYSDKSILESFNAGDGSNLLESGYNSFRDRLISNTLSDFQNKKFSTLSAQILLNHMKDPQSTAFSFAFLLNPTERGSSFRDEQKNFIKSLTEADKHNLYDIYGKDTVDSLIETYNKLFDYYKHLKPSEYDTYFKWTDSVQKISSHLQTKFISKYKLTSDPEFSQNFYTANYTINSILNTWNIDLTSNSEDYYNFSLNLQESVSGLFQSKPSPNSEFATRNLEAVRTSFVNEAIEHFNADRSEIIANRKDIKSLEVLLAIQGSMTPEQLKAKYPQIDRITNEIGKLVVSLVEDPSYSRYSSILGDPRLWNLLRTVNPINTFAYKYGSFRDKTENYYIYSFLQKINGNSQESDIKLFTELLPNNARFGFGGETVSKSLPDLETIINDLATTYPNVARNLEKAKVLVKEYLETKAVSSMNKLRTNFYVAALQFAEEHLKSLSETEE